MKRLKPVNTEHVLRSPPSRIEARDLQGAAPVRARYRLGHAKRNNDRLAAGRLEYPSSGNPSDRPWCGEGLAHTTGAWDEMERRILGPLPGSQPMICSPASWRSSRAMSFSGGTRQTATPPGLARCRSPSRPRQEPRHRSARRQGMVEELRLTRADRSCRSRSSRSWRRPRTRRPRAR